MQNRKDYFTGVYKRLKPYFKTDFISWEQARKSVDEDFKKAREIYNEQQVRNEMFLALGLLSVWFSKYVAMSITSTVCSGIFSTFVMLLMVWERTGVEKRVPDSLKKAVKWLAVLSFPIVMEL